MAIIAVTVFFFTIQVLTCMSAPEFDGYKRTKMEVLMQLLKLGNLQKHIDHPHYTQKETLTQDTTSKDTHTQSDDCAGQKWCGCEGVIKKVDKYQNDMRLIYCQGDPCIDIVLWVKNLDMEIRNHRLCLLSKPDPKYNQDYDPLRRPHKQVCLFSNTTDVVSSGIYLSGVVNLDDGPFKTLTNNIELGMMVDPAQGFKSQVMYSDPILPVCATQPMP